MSRLIDADAFVHDLAEWYVKESPIMSGYGNQAAADMIWEFIKAVNKRPTIDAVPVKHGHWITDEDGDSCCSVCGDHLSGELNPFKLTQTELGEKTGMTCAMISYIERGKHEPTERTIRKICTALDITESCLHDAAGEWRLGQGGRMICPYCGKGQLRTKREVEQYGYQLDQIRFCIFCGREVKQDDS